jgi:hypothetical protein
MSSIRRVPSSSDSRNRLAFLLAGLLLGVSVAEVALRSKDPVRGWRDELVPQQVSELDIHQLSDDVELLYELVPKLSMQREGPYGPYSLSTTARGVRGDEGDGSRPRILVLGGSNTFGPGVGDEQTWPAQMALHLPDYEVVNLGVSGYMTRQKVALGRKHLDVTPELVLLQVYNTGRRFVLHGTTDEAFDRWPQLWSEYFIGTGGSMWTLASWRTAVIGWNRSNQRTVADSLYQGTVDADREAVLALAEELGDVPLVLVIPAAGGELHGVDLPRIDLSAMNPPDTEIHPDAPGHAWAGERVAEGLEPWLGARPESP